VTAVQSGNVLTQPFDSAPGGFGADSTPVAARRSDSVLGLRHLFLVGRLATRAFHVPPGTPLVARHELAELSPVTEDLVWLNPLVCFEPAKPPPPPPIRER